MFIVALVKNIFFAFGVVLSFYSLGQFFEKPLQKLNLKLSFHETIGLGLLFVVLVTWSLMGLVNLDWTFQVLFWGAFIMEIAIALRKKSLQSLSQSSMPFLNKQFLVFFLAVGLSVGIAIEYSQTLAPPGPEDLGYFAAITFLASVFQITPQEALSPLVMGWSFLLAHLFIGLIKNIVRKQAPKTILKELLLFVILLFPFW